MSEPIHAEGRPSTSYAELTPSFGSNGRVQGQSGPSTPSFGSNGRISRPLRAKAGAQEMAPKERRRQKRRALRPDEAARSGPCRYFQNLERSPRITTLCCRFFENLE